MYTVRKEFFDKANDPYLMAGIDKFGHDKSAKRPHLYAHVDSKGLVWLVPCTHDFNKIVDSDGTKTMKIQGKMQGLLYRSMFPVRPEYLVEYTVGSRHVGITNPKDRLSFETHAKSIENRLMNGEILSRFPPDVKRHHSAMLEEQKNINLHHAYQAIADTYRDKVLLHQSEGVFVALGNNANIVAEALGITKEDISIGISQSDTTPAVRIAAAELMDYMEKLTAAGINVAISREDGSLEIKEAVSVMNEKAKKGVEMQSETKPVPFELSPEIQVLLQLLNDNNKQEQVAALISLINNVKTMEDTIKSCASTISTMKNQLVTLKEVQSHPIKTIMTNDITKLENGANTIRSICNRIKQDILDGCKSVIEAVKDKGIAMLNNIATYFGVKDFCEHVETKAQNTITRCENSIAKIEAFSTEYHKAGNAIKNLGRMLVGKETVDANQKAGELTVVICSPYREAINRLTIIRDNATDSIQKLDKLSAQVDDNIHEKRNTKNAEKPNEKRASWEEIKQKAKKNPKIKK